MSRLGSSEYYLGFVLTVDEDEDHENSHGEILIGKAEGAVVEHPTEARHIIGISQPLKDFQSGLICRCFCYIQIAEGLLARCPAKPCTFTSGHQISSLSRLAGFLLTSRKTPDCIADNPELANQQLSSIDCGGGAKLFFW